MKKLKSALFLSFCLALLLSTYTVAGAAGMSFTAAQTEVDSLSLRVDELVARIESSSPTGTPQEQHRLFRTLDKEIDVLEAEIDLLEDKCELSYLSGTLSWEEYRSLERRLDKLEGKLDKAEDHLERTFRSVR